MAATAVHPFHGPPGNKGPPIHAPGGNFVQMKDGAGPPMFDIDAEEARVWEKKGRRLRRAALGMGILMAISIVCQLYSLIVVRWAIIDYYQPEKTAYQIIDRIGAFKFGLFCDTIMIIADSFVGILMGMILVGSGVNPAMSVMVVVFRVIQQAILGANTINMMAALVLLDPTNRLYNVIQTYFYSDWTLGIGQNLAYLFLIINRYGHIYSEFFAGISMLLFGFIIVMWGVFPRCLGYCILVSGPCFILSSFFYIFWPKYDGNLTVIFMIPVFISYIGLSGWCIVSTPHPAKNRDFIPGLTESRSENVEPQQSQYQGPPPQI